MSKKAEIMMLMKKRSLIAIYREDYETVATEIEKIFEVGGKVEYWIQGRSVKWYDIEKVTEIGSKNALS